MIRVHFENLGEFLGVYVCNWHVLPALLVPVAFTALFPLYWFVVAPAVWAQYPPAFGPRSWLIGYWLVAATIWFVFLCVCFYHIRNRRSLPVGHDASGTAQKNGAAGSTPSGSTEEDLWPEDEYLSDAYVSESAYLPSPQGGGTPRPPEFRLSVGTVQPDCEDLEPRREVPDESWDYDFDKDMATTSNNNNCIQPFQGAPWGRPFSGYGSRPQVRSPTHLYPVPRHCRIQQGSPRSPGRMAGPAPFALPSRSPMFLRATAGDQSSPSPSSTPASRAPSPARPPPPFSGTAVATTMASHLRPHHRDLKARLRQPPPPPPPQQPRGHPGPQQVSGLCSKSLPQLAGQSGQVLLGQRRGSHGVGVGGGSFHRRIGAFRKYHGTPSSVRNYLQRRRSGKQQREDSGVNKRSSSDKVCLTLTTAELESAKQVCTGKIDRKDSLVSEAKFDSIVASLQSLATEIERDFADEKAATGSAAAVRGVQTDRLRRDLKTSEGPKNGGDLVPN